MKSQLPDRRYTVTPEYTGHASAEPRYVLRFCGRFISEHATPRAAERAAWIYQEDRLDVCAYA